MSLIAALAIGGVLLLGMIVAAGYAGRTLPAHAGVPLHAGAPEYSLWLSKRAGLAAWLGIGVAAFAVFGFLTVSSVAANWSPSVRVVLLPSVMCVALAAEAAAIITARRSGTAAAPATEPAAEPVTEPVTEPATEQAAAPVTD